MLSATTIKSPKLKKWSKHGLNSLSSMTTISWWILKWPVTHFVHRHFWSATAKRRRNCTTSSFSDVRSLWRKAAVIRMHSSHWNSNFSFQILMIWVGRITGNKMWMPFTPGPSSNQSKSKGTSLQSQCMASTSTTPSCSQITSQRWSTARFWPHLSTSDSHQPRH